MISHYRKLWISIVIVLSVLALATCIIAILDDFIRIPPHELTTTRMFFIQRRIFDYIREHGATPQNLEQLSKIDGYDNSTEDGWRRPILYSVDSNSVVTLKSFGADGRPGGDGKSKDIVQSFFTKDANGKWLSDDERAHPRIVTNPVIPWFHKGGKQ